MQHTRKYARKYASILGQYDRKRSWKNITNDAVPKRKSKSKTLE